MITLTVQMTIDETTDSAGAHAVLEAVLAAGGTVTATGGPTTPAVVADERKTLRAEELRTVLQQLADGEVGRPLNDGERAMLIAIAEHAPAVFTYDENRQLLGSGAKFGNVSSGLARRFWNRGFELPYAESPSRSGYVMDEPTAAVVLDVLSPGSPSDA